MTVKYSCTKQSQDRVNKKLKTLTQVYNKLYGKRVVELHMKALKEENGELRKQ